MKICALTLNLPILTFLLFTLNQPIFAQSSEPFTALKLSILKKDKLVHDTILNIQNEPIPTIEFKVNKHKKEHIIHLKTLIAADGSERLTILKLENMDTLNTSFSPNFKIRIAPALTSTSSKERIGSLEIDSLNGKKGIFYYTHPLFKDSASPKTVNFEVYTEGVDSATAIAIFSMKIIQPGVVMVHGLNSSRKEFRALSFFLKRKKYKKFHLNSFNYIDSLGFARNRNVLPKAIDSLLESMEKNMVLTLSSSICWGSDIKVSLLRWVACISKSRASSGADSIPASDKICAPCVSAARRVMGARIASLYFEGEIFSSAVNLRSPRVCWPDLRQSVLQRIHQSCRP